MEAALRVVKEFMAEVEPGTVEGQDALRLVRFFVEVERVGCAGRTRYALRTESTNNDPGHGQSSSGSWFAEQTGTSVSEANADLRFARSVSRHKDIEVAFNACEISKAQAAEIASVADVAPDMAGELVRRAKEMSFGGLVAHCRQLKAAIRSKEEAEARQERVRRGRSVTTWIGEDGLGRLLAKLSPENLNRVTAALEPLRQEIFERSRAEGERLGYDAYLADALVEALTSESSSKKSPTGKKVTESTKNTLVRIRVDLSALLRGETEPGETCSLIGFDEPIPVARVRELIPGSILELIATRGTDVRTICTDSRYVSKAIQAALDERDRSCVVTGCARTYPLEHHHVVGFADGGSTSIDNLATLCRAHHDLVTNKGYTLEGPPGHWKLHPPGPSGPRAPEACDTEQTPGAHTGKEPPGPAPPRRRTQSVGPAQSKLL